ncbi:galactokinase [Lacihabitans sp. LS3-19]|nr:galactokinase [Lacihabitans sp. LS3-19]
MLQKVEEKYISIFNKSSEIRVKAPGRINILGEHTDYNNGYVMPSAIDKGIYYSIGKRNDQKLEIYAIDLNQHFEAEDINNLEIKDKTWSNHLTGVLLEIAKLGLVFPNGLNICFGGDIPNGAGLSSSAAVEAGIGFGINQIFNFQISLLTLAKIAQATEHNYVGVKCGIMDMYASLFSKKGHVIKLDCQSLEHEYIPADFEDYTFVLVNSDVKHNLADSEYNIRRAQCQEGVNVLNQKFGGINTLRDVTFEQLKSVKTTLDPIVFNRCQYILEEKERVEQASDALIQQDFKKLGEIMNKTHEGLSHMYEVSCEELDFLQKEACKIEGVLGSRMMGGGFGGCTLNLLKNSEADNFKEKISASYFDKFNITPEVYTVHLSQGVQIIA